MKQKTIIHLLSGGLDSVVLLYYLKSQGYNVHCLLFDYKQRHKEKLIRAEQHAIKCGVLYTTIELPELGGLTEQSWIVPNRNAVFLSVAVNFACQVEAYIVTIGCNAADAQSFPDCSKEFLDAMNAAIRAAGYGVQIWAPFLDYPKWKVEGLAREMGIQIAEFSNLNEH